MKNSQQLSGTEMNNVSKGNYGEIAVSYLQVSVVQIIAQMAA
jgi:hypothetical protein